MCVILKYVHLSCADVYVFFSQHKQVFILALGYTMDMKFNVVFDPSFVK